MEICFGEKIKLNNPLSEEHKIKHGLRHGCPLSRTLFNIYMNEVIVKWKQIYTKLLLYQLLQNKRPSLCRSSSRNS